MRILYILLSITGVLITGYLFANDFTFDNATFSNYLINTLLIVLLCLLAIIGIGYLIYHRRKTYSRGMMTIRQYYEYKSAR